MVDVSDNLMDPQSPDVFPSEYVSFPLVGIGASAGGLEAFTQLLADLPNDDWNGLILRAAPRTRP